MLRPAFKLSKLATQFLTYIWTGFFCISFAHSMSSDFLMSTKDLKDKLETIAISALNSSQLEMEYDEQIYIDAERFIKKLIEKLTPTLEVVKVDEQTISMSRTKFDDFQHQALEVGKFGANFAKQLQEKTDHESAVRTQEKEINIRSMIKASEEEEKKFGTSQENPLVNLSELNSIKFDDWRNMLSLPTKPTFQKQISRQAAEASNAKAILNSPPPPKSDQPILPTNTKTKSKQATSQNKKKQEKKSLNQKVNRFFKKSLDTATKPFSNAAKQVSKTMSKSISTVTKTSQKAIKAVSGTVGKATKAIGKSLKTATKAVGKTTNKITKSSKKIIGKASKSSKKIVKSTSSSFKRAGKKIKKAFKR